jgi:hypothetical protein
VPDSPLGAAHDHLPDAGRPANLFLGQARRHSGDPQFGSDPTAQPSGTLASGLLAIGTKVPHARNCGLRPLPGPY